MGDGRCGSSIQHPHLGDARDRRDGRSGDVGIAADARLKSESGRPSCPRRFAHRAQRVMARRDPPNQALPRVMEPLELLPFRALTRVTPAIRSHSCTGVILVITLRGCGCSVTLVRAIGLGTGVRRSRDGSAVGARVGRLPSTATSLCRGNPGHSRDTGPVVLACARAHAARRAGRGCGRCRLWLRCGSRGHGRGQVGVLVGVGGRSRGERGWMPRGSVRGS